MHEQLSITITLRQRPVEALNTRYFASVKIHVWQSDVETWSVQGVMEIGKFCRPHKMLDMQTVILLLHMIPLRGVLVSLSASTPCKNGPTD